MGGLAAWLTEERGRLLPWLPLFMGAGAAGWLNWPGNPSAATLAGAGLIAGAGLWLHLRGGLFGYAIGACIMALCAGFLLTELRALYVAAPVLGHRYYGPVEGRVIAIDRSNSDKLRLTLDQLRLERVAPDRLPDRVRISLRGDWGLPTPQPGTRVMLTAHLAPPSGSAEPDGFDFQRLAWFRGIGAVGYSRTPVLELAPAGVWDARVTRLRLYLSGAITDRIDGASGALAAAMMTGDRAAMEQSDVVALRDSNLYHLVSISGVHMSLLAGFILLACRTSLAAIPPLALRLPTRKIAAVVALVGSGFYLILAGRDVATMRAFVMVAVMLGAVLLDRRAISLRSIGLAATIVLVLQPEAVAEPGFQMSFAAASALVVGFGILRDRGTLRRLHWSVRPLAASLLASLLAGGASAPFAAAHFNRFADYGLLANLLASPAMAILVMPGGVLAAALAPLGIAAPALWMLDLGCRWILWVGEWVSGLEGQIRLIAAPAAYVLPINGFGGAVTLLARGRARLFGLGPLLFCAVFWQGQGRPDLLIAGDGALVGVLTSEGRALSAPRGNGFTAKAWLESDADPADQRQAAAREGFDHRPLGITFDLAGVTGLLVKDRAAIVDPTAACRIAQLVIIYGKVDGSIPTPPNCTIIDREVLARSGPISGELVPHKGIILHATRPRWMRPWSGRADPPDWSELAVRADAVDQ